MSQIMRKHLRKVNVVVRCLDSTIPIHAKSKISNHLLLSVAEQAGLSLTWSHIPKTDFLVTWLKW